MEVMELVGLVVRVSVLFFVGWCVALVLAECYRHLWNWLDDHDRPIERNPLMAWVLRVCVPQGEGVFEVWAYVLLITLWPLYLLGVAAYYAAKGARGLRRWYKRRQVAAVSA
ncbi:hypothetical protein LIS66_27330 (plasmid) [Pseudomonas sp. HN2]|uniref:hypothetical protein n=1 Tax=Pseudomonas sp. HN2 TaxID=2884805 RepID=UPI001D158DDF|nr:hypothetical protein [Pseudomonas sp. HN2]UEB98689.1 hypothetical protein LIS66_27625 [Pseudomonas sp. HN2]UEB98745.1 hypothetical protein LIS66_27330 [Pseudomonas sp. HN2]